MADALRELPGRGVRRRVDRAGDGTVLPAPTKIVSLRPTGFEAARTVGEHIRASTPVVMDLTEMEEAEAKRMVDFASGLVFGTCGGIERIARRVFLLTPADVEVMVIDRPLDETGFYNQS
ncbi:cell division protein SepF [Kitasatospora aburaviensis]